MANLSRENTLKRLTRFASYRPGARMGLAIRWGLGLGCLITLLFYLDPQKLASTLGRTNWSLAGPAIAGLVAIHLIGAATWKMLASRLSGANWHWAYITKAYYAGQATGSVTPSNIGADVYRVYATAGGAHTWQQAALSVGAHRIASYLALLILGIAATVFVPSPVALAAILALATGLLCVTVTGASVLAKRPASPDSVVGRLVAKLGLQSWRTVPGRRLWIPMVYALILQVIFHAGSVALAYVLLLSIGGQAAALPALSAITLARLAILVPFSISGLGFQEGALATLFPLVGLPAETGLAVSVLSRLAMLLTLALGASLIFVSRKRTSGQTGSQPRVSARSRTESLQ